MWQIKSLEISIEEMRLVYAGRQVEDCQTLEECDISGEATLHLNLCLVGGGKKRKKKTFTKPKKIAHKKKKVKLHVLQFYRVDENGKVTRLRRECSNKECGAGTFMAKHQNREYCGRCGLTLFPKQQA